MKTDLIYASRARRTTVANQAVAIHCSDQRFQDAFREFLTEGLGLISYGLIAIPGGGHFTSLTEIMPKFAKVGFQSLSFMIERTGARRIILVGHEDCLFFKEFLGFYFTEAHLHDKQFTGLRKAGRALRERFEGQSVELYFADASADGTVQFLKLE
jgi:hypothetical protein